MNANAGEQSDSGSHDGLRRLRDQLDAAISLRRQMSDLLRLTIEIGSDLHLDAALHRVVSAAAAMTGAKYAALGVWGADGTMGPLVLVGMDPGLMKRLGPLPWGGGVLGELRNQTEPLRIADLTVHPSSIGFPEIHPPIRAFLGVPLTMRGYFFGCIYVADDLDGRLFTDADEATMMILAAAASVAIQNANLCESIRSAARMAHVSAEITTTLVSGSESDPLRLIADRAGELTNAEQVMILVPGEADSAGEFQTLIVAAAVGRNAHALVGQQVPVAGSTSGEVFASREPVITNAFRYPVPALTDLGDRPAIVIPLTADEHDLGVLVLIRNQSEMPFEASDLDLIADFAGRVAIALTLSTAREYARELSVLTDRERIARDLHDRVIQRIFAVAIEMQSTAARVRTPELAERIDGAISQLQQVITDIRVSIFDLKQPTDRQNALAHRIQRVVSQATDNTDMLATLQTRGALNVVSPHLTDDAEAVVIEALSNVVRHSGADTVTVMIAVDDEFHIDICDDGRGIGDDNYRSSGLDNMIQRAKLAGGHCGITTPSSGGTRINWVAPLLPP